MNAPGPIADAGRGPRPPPALKPRRIAVVIWGSMVAFLVVFLAMVLAVEPPGDDPHAPRRLLLGLAVGASVLGIALSRVLPPRIPARQTGDRPASNALVRLLVAWSLCEAAAVFPLVAHVLIHDHRLLAVFAANALALLTLFPTENVWAHLSASQANPPPGREVG